MKRKSWIVEDLLDKSETKLDVIDAPTTISTTSLDWAFIDLPYDSFDNQDDEMGGMCCIQEIEDVDVVYSESKSGGKLISFKKSSSKKNKKRKQQIEDAVDQMDFVHVDDFQEDSRVAEDTRSLTRPLENNPKDHLEQYVLATDVNTSLLPVESKQKRCKENVAEPEAKAEKIESIGTPKNIQNPDKQTPFTEIKAQRTVSMDAWHEFNLNQNLLKAISELMFAFPTEIQQKVLPIALFGEKDIIGVAQTGSGKTLAFGLPLLQKLQGLTHNGVYALILAPTRELALQITEHLKELAKYTNTKIITLVGGLSQQKQKRLIDSSPDIVVATPGRLWDLMDNYHEFSQQLHQIKYLVLDEADRMLEQGHFKEFENIMRNLYKGKVNTLLPNVYLFSATLLDDSRLKGLLKKEANVQETSALDKMLSKIQFRNTPVYLNVLTNNKIVAKGLVEKRIDCLVKEKDLYLYYIVTQFPGRILVFVNAIDGIRRLVPILNLLNVPCYGLHAEMQQRQRLKNLDRFKDQKHAVLIASDVAARGLDIPSIQHVIHYQLPRTADLYVHRSGRTARALSNGISVMLCSPEESKVYKKICSILKNSTGIPEFSVDRLLVADLKPRVELAKKINQMEHNQQKISHDNNWMKKAAEDADIILDLEEELLENTLNKPELKQLKNNLKNTLLHKPIAPSLRRGVLSGHTNLLSQL